MSQKERAPVLIDALIAVGPDRAHPRAMTSYQVRAVYESEITKLRDTVQVLVDAAYRARTEHISAVNYLPERGQELSQASIDNLEGALARCKDELGIVPTETA